MAKRLTNADFRRKLGKMDGPSGKEGREESAAPGKGDDDAEMLRKENLRNFVKQEKHRNHLAARREEMRERRRKEASAREASVETAGAGGRKGPRYRDRAAERRKGRSDYDEDAIERAANVDRELSKVLGGDEEHTHLVKGLDVVLLQRVRQQLREAEETKAAPAAGAGDTAEVAPVAASGPEDDSEESLLALLGPAKAVEDVRFHSLLGRTLTANVLIPAAREARAGKGGDGASSAKAAFLPGRTAYDVPTDPFAADPLRPPVTVTRAPEDCPDPGGVEVQGATWAMPDRLTQELSRIFGPTAGAGGKERKRRRRRDTAGEATTGPAAATGSDGASGSHDASRAGRTGGVEEEEGEDDDDDIFAGAGHFDPSEALSSLKGGRSKQDAPTGEASSAGRGRYFAEDGEEEGMQPVVSKADLAKTVRQLAEAEEKRRARKEEASGAAGGGGGGQGGEQRRFAGVGGTVAAEGHMMSDALSGGDRAKDSERGDAYTEAMEEAVAGAGGGGVASAVEEAERRARAAAEAEEKEQAAKLAAIRSAGVPRAAQAAGRTRQVRADGQWDYDEELDAMLEPESKRARK